MGAAVYVSPLMAATDFGNWLEQRMGDLPISQAELSRASGVNEGSLSRYRSATATPDPATIRKLAVPLQASVEEMLRLAGHVEGMSDDDGKTLIIRTTNPKVVKLVRTTEDLDDEEIARAVAALEALFPKRKK